MAYAAVLSLKQILEQISHPYLEEHRIPLQGKLSSLLDFLDVSWQKRSEEIRCLESEIRDAVYKAEDIIESHIWKNFNEEGFQERQRRDVTFYRNLEKVGDDIDSIKIRISKLKELLPTTYLPPGPSRLASGGNNKGMVGLDNDLIEIMDRLTGYQTPRQIIPVIGMGGIGKTTLARNVYDHPVIKHHFHIRAWASISQEYREREVLLSLLDSMNNLGAEMCQEKSDEELSEYLYKSLKRRRYLVVLDDVWNNEAWDSLSRIFPNDGTRSRILLTTRMSSVVNYINYHSSPHHMQFLNKTDSWNLLRQELFWEDTCPHELEEAGKEIAENCKGLPLSLVVIGGYLSNAARTREHWEYVVENVKSVINATQADCLEMVSLSYDYLPHHLKACFLYMGVFREDEKIRVSKLFKLWVAEGFLKPVEGKSLEQVAEECLEDLISRNLILICDKKSNGKIKTCSIHDLLRELCIKKAQEENFFHVTDNDVKIFASGIKCLRRLCIQLDVLGEESSKSNNSDVNKYKGSLATVRSILYPVFASEIFENGGAKVHFPLLRVLDFLACESGFPYGVVKLVHSRYLSFFFKGKISIPKMLPGVIWYLQTLIIDCEEVHLPLEIWRMAQLRHLLFNKCYLPCPTEENFVLRNLLTLSKLSSASCTKEVFKRVPHLKKLGICIARNAYFSLGYLINLPQLETLKWSIEDGDYLERRIPFCPLPVSRQPSESFMPNLEVLKLRNNAFSGPKWEPAEGEFCRLKFLLLDSMNLVQWKTDHTNFQRLESLQIFHCHELEEIPCSIGDVTTLQMIELDDASPSVVTSANQIKEEQENLGNESPQVRVRYIYSNISEKVKEAVAEVVSAAGSNDYALQLDATTMFCKTLKAGQIQPIKEAIQSALIPSLIKFLASDYWQLQDKAVDVLVSLSTGSSEYIKVLIDHGAIPVLASLLGSPSNDVHEQALPVAFDSRTARYMLQLNTTVLFLKLLLIEESPLVDEVIQSAIVPRFVEFLERDSYPLLQFVAAQALEIITRMSVSPKVVVDHGAVPVLVRLLSCSDDDVRWQAVCVLANVTFHSPNFRDLVLDCGALMPILAQINDEAPLSMLQIVASILRLFLSGEPLAEFEQVLPAFLALAHLIEEDDDSILYDVCLALLNLSTGPKNQIGAVIDAGFCPRLVELLLHPLDVVAYHAMCGVLNIITDGDYMQCQAMIEAGIASPLIQLLQNATVGIHELDIQGTAAWTIRNVTDVATDEQIKLLVHKGCIKALCDLLVSPDPSIVMLCLEGLENILEVGEAEKNLGNEDVNVFAQMIDDAEGLEKIENLENHDSSEIHDKAVKILQTYWSKEVDEISSQLRSLTSS